MHATLPLHAGIEYVAMTFADIVYIPILPNLGWIAARAPNRVNRAHGPPRKISKICAIFVFFRPTEKMAREDPKWGRDAFLRHKKNLADNLGRTDFDFENF